MGLAERDERECVCAWMFGDFRECQNHLFVCVAASLALYVWASCVVPVIHRDNFLPRKLPRSPMRINEAWRRRRARKTLSSSFSRSISASLQPDQLSRFMGYRELRRTSGLALYHQGLSWRRLANFMPVIILDLIICFYFGWEHASNLSYGIDGVLLVLR